MEKVANKMPKFKKCEDGNIHKVIQSNEQSCENNTEKKVNNAERDF